MPMAFEVRLPKSQAPVFPTQCPACGADDAAASVKLSTNAIGWMTVVSWMPGRRFSVDVPVCVACARRIRRQKWIRFGVSFALIVGAVFAATILVDRYQGPFKKWIGVGVTFVLLLPLIAWEVFNPMPMDVTAFAEHVDYEFADAEYAMEFAELNGSTVK